jgi:hypothetical protein
MSTTLTTHNETASGHKTNTFTLDCLTERMTVRELIRARIYQEVRDYNQKEPEFFRGLVEPTQAESRTSKIGKGFFKAPAMPMRWAGARRAQREKFHRPVR